jgi:hypothetical protein
LQCGTRRKPLTSTPSGRQPPPRFKELANERAQHNANMSGFHVCAANVRTEPEGLTMQLAIVDRIEDLEKVAARLKAILNAERPGAMLPTISLCRLAIDVDETANRLAAHAEQLTAPESIR